MTGGKKVVAVLIAYKASKTLENFYNSFPKNFVDEIILVDDASPDNTYELAQKLGIKSYRNPVNLGYGGNMKRAFNLALKNGADIIIDIHPDGEYKPSAIPAAVKEIESGAGMVLGNRFTSIKSVLRTGMFKWKIPLIMILNKIDELILGVKLDDLHQGFRVYSRKFLEKANFEINSNDYLFSFEIIIQAIYHGEKIAQVPVETIYTGEKRGANFKNCLIYSFCTFWTLFLFILAKLSFRTKIFKEKKHA